MEKKEKSKINAVTPNTMDRLPQDIIIRILSRLPLTDLMQSKLVCRAWQSLIQNPHLVSEHFSHTVDNGPSFVIQSHLPDNTYQLFFTDLSHDSQGNLILKKLPSVIKPMYLVDSCNGLLCMRDAKDRIIYIYNPFTRVCIELPEVNCPEQLGHLEFGFHPTTKEYKLVHVVQRYGPNPNSNQSGSIRYSEVHVLTMGSPAWRNLGKIPHGSIRTASKVTIKGRLHWLSNPSLLISFDLQTEQFQELPKPDCLGKCFHRLLILLGCVSIAAYQKGKLEIWVMKEYGVKESWTKEFNIGIFLPRAWQQSRFHGQRIVFSTASVRVICSLKSGEILLEYGSRLLVLYDPQQGTFKELTIPEKPIRFRIKVHVGSLNWLDTPPNN
ncbi:hypothetical protein COLO4_25855 [Corchorus olitorius]|uniref:F-box domain-containing protein n=1 Tax=Corchorus olitorius TaxID=93759 RepID=A0A1R3HZQ0_9ROSI|nr:hypothetical protein COLO4_25855 [Corchorus olitorius]